MNRLVKRIEQMLGRLVLTAMLLMLVACSSSDGQGTSPADRFGPENYGADLIVMSFEAIDDVGEGVVYRAPSSLESLVAGASEVIVLTIYQPGQEALHRIQPWMEQLAADQQGAVLPVLASSSASDPFLDHFETSGWPSFFVVHQSSIKLSVYGYSEENHALIMSKINDLLSEN